MQMLNAIFVSEIEIENLPPKLMRKYLTDILINIARTVYQPRWRQMTLYHQ